jgi:NAD(P)H-hydrate epimerase
VCGPGQNGGDGLVVARHLAVAGGTPSIVLLAPSSGGTPPGDAGTNLRICRAMGLRIVEVRGVAEAAAASATIRSAALVVDALFGTGLTRGLEGAATALVGEIASAARPVLALDLPSGLDCDTGEPLGPCVRADLTATFVAPKAGFMNPASRAWTGEVVVVGIGAPLDWRVPDRV